MENFSPRQAHPDTNYSLVFLNTISRDSFRCSSRNCSKSSFSYSSKDCLSFTHSFKGLFRLVSLILQDFFFRALFLQDILKELFQKFPKRVSIIPKKNLTGFWFSKILAGLPLISLEIKQEILRSMFPEISPEVFQGLLNNFTRYSKTSRGCPSDISSGLSSETTPEIPHGISPEVFP